jgi:hypothetical protein
MDDPIVKDEAGPLWLLLEDLLEPVWVRITLGSVFVFVILALIAFIVHRKR